MPVYYASGHGLIAEETFLDNSRSERRLLGDGQDGPRVPDTRAPSHPDRQSKKPNTPVLSIGEPAPFVATGIGKPMTISITSAYPGDLVPRSLFGSPSVLVSSAVRSWQTVDAQPRALNILKSEVRRRRAIGMPAAVEQGTPILYYSPAVVDRALIVTVEFSFEDVNADALNGVGGVFSAAAGLPLFLSAAPYLLAAGSLFKLGGALGKRLFDSNAEFQVTESVNLALDGRAGFSGYAVLARSPFESKQLQSYTISDTGMLVDRDGNPYDGEIPHVVLSVDGRADPALEKFSSAALCASLLKRFHNVGENGQTDAKILVDALTLYNDFSYSRQAASLKAEIEATDGADERAQLQRRHDALLKNIKNDEFKPQN